ncbi:MAG TPA: porin [Caldimonas sp.]|nr:porin [Caldimonas sp.]
MNRFALHPVARAAALVCAAGSAVAAIPAFAAEPQGSNAAVIRKLENQNETLARTLAEVQQQLQAMKQQLDDMKRQGSSVAEQQKAQGQQVEQAVAQQQRMKTEVAAATQAASQASQQAAVQAARSDVWNRFSLWGYGEVYYLRPTHRSEQTNLDLARAVFGIGYQFDDKTRFNSEYEVEHAVSSADDPGEFEVEQFYVDRKINDAVSGRAGLFLIPAGLLNENHEPTNFYGVQRNFVETLIIPSTWREGGLSVYGTTDSGFDWNVGLTTGMDLSKWDFAPEAPLYNTAQQLINNGVAPLQATHQELALADARRLAQYASLNWRGVPGLTLGGTYFTGGAVPAQPDIGSQRTRLWETHARWQPGRWDLSALYARGSISNTGAANARFPGTANPMPSKFDGWFVQAAYNLWQRDGYRLAPFARWERYDMGAGYEGIAPGFPTTPTGPVPSSTSPTTFDYFAVPRDHVATLGANFYLNPNVVLKFDFQKFRTNTDFTRVDLGLGLQF